MSDISIVAALGLYVWTGTQAEFDAGSGSNADLLKAEKAVRSLVITTSGNKYEWDGANWNLLSAGGAGRVARPADKSGSLKVGEIADLSTTKEIITPPSGGIKLLIVWYKDDGAGAATANKLYLGFLGTAQNDITQAGLRRQSFIDSTEPAIFPFDDDNLPTAVEIVSNVAETGNSSIYYEMVYG